jgi:hypothetical protein
MSLMIVWCLAGAIVLMLPCLVVLLEFCSVAATIGALLLYLYTVVCLVLLVIALRTVGFFLKKPVLQVVGWSGIFVAWWWFVDSYFFIFVGVPCGYVLANPVLCCAAAPWSCFLVWYVGIYGLLAVWLLVTGGAVVGWWYSFRARAVVGWYRSCASFCAVFLASVLLLCGATFSVHVMVHDIRQNYCGVYQNQLIDVQQVEKQDISKQDISKKVSGKNGTYGALKEPPLKCQPYQAIRAFKMSGEEKGVLAQAHALREQFEACCAVPQQPDLIIGPESCLPCALNTELSLCAFFDDPGACKVPYIILGARRSEKKSSGADEVSARYNEVSQRHNGYTVFNTVYVLHQGRIIFHYDKQFPLPFLETTGFCSCIPFLQGLFFTKEKSTDIVPATSMPLLTARPTERESFSQHCPTGEASPHEYFPRCPYAVGASARDCALTIASRTYQVRFALCSDFFCTKIQPPQGSNPLLVVLTHDTWFYGGAVATAMMRYAVLWAVEHRVPVLYCGFRHRAWINERGKVNL